MRHSTFRGHHNGSESIDADGSVDSTVATLSLRHYFADRFSAGLVLPTGVLRFDSGAGPVQRASGFGDVEMIGRYALRRGTGYRTHVDAELALALPTGTSNLSSAMAVGEAPPNILSVGRGTFGGRARVAASKFVTKSLVVRTWLGASAPVTANSSNIVFGTMINTGLGVSYLAAKSWTIAPQVSGSMLTHSRSTVNGELVNSGGFWLNAELVGAYRVTDDFSVSMTARLPIYRDVNGTQITDEGVKKLQEALPNCTIRRLAE
jgi:hypothetical protein